MRELVVMLKEHMEEVLVIKQVNDATSLADRVHAQLRSADVDRADSSLGRDHRSDGAAARAILLNDEVLERDWWIGGLCNDAH